MKIKEIKVWSVDLGNTKPYTIAFKTIDEVRNAFVEITLENGLTGIGAGNPSEYVVGETLDQCLEALQEKNLDFLIGRCPPHCASGAVRPPERVSLTDHGVLRTGDCPAGLRSVPRSTCQRKTRVAFRVSLLAKLVVGRIRLTSVGGL